MRRLVAFNNVSLDGYFVDANGDMSWAHDAAEDPEFDAFTAGNASGGGTLVFGRVTYEMMAGFWPTPMAAARDPVVAERMNAMPKVVFSRTLRKASWQNTTLFSGNLAAEIRKLKQMPGEGLAILGSGTIVAQLAQEGLIDEFQLVVNPLVLGAGRTMFEGVTQTIALNLLSSRAFKNGKVVLSYTPKV